MNQTTTVLRTLESEISRYDFQKTVDSVKNDKRIRKFPTKQMFSALIFGQLTNGYSIREIQHGLDANNHRLYHNGLSPIKRSTFADALSKRDYRIFERLHEQLTEHCVTFKIFYRVINSIFAYFYFVISIFQIYRKNRQHRPLIWIWFS